MTSLGGSNLPFTFAHPAIVIPLKRISGRWFNLTALVFGSMAPDFEYFVRMKTVTTISHTVTGIFAFDLSIVIVLSILFQRVIREPLLLYLPRPLDHLFDGTRDVLWRINSMKEFFVFIYSALIGIVSHTIWDSFTHLNGVVVSNLSFLKEYLNIFGYQIPIYKFLQHGSTLVGLMLIGIFILTCPKRGNLNELSTVVKKRYKAYFWLIVMITALIVTCVRVGLDNQPFNIQLFGTILVTLISGTMIGLLLASVTSKVWMNS